MNDARTDEELFSLASLDGADGPARPLSTAATNALIDSVLDGVGAPPSGGSSGAAAGKGLIGAKIAVGIAVLAMAGGGGLLTMREPRERFVANVPRPSPSVEEAGVAPVVTAPEEEPDMVFEELLPEEPEARAERTPERRAPAAPAVTPPDLLAEANRLRRSGSYAQAEATYRQVVQLNPRGREAHVARVAAASLRLDRLNDPAGAASLYRQAARGSGGLAAEATFGLARASRALGDRGAETQALRAVVERFPRSPYARPATDRLRSLGVNITPREGQ
jgi:hypothetical protein